VTPFEGKVAVVTGAGSGIGRAAALAFAAQGARVVVGDVVEAGGKETVRMIAKSGGEACFARADVTREDEVEAMIARAVDRYGALDCAFNNAGVPGDPGPIIDASLESFQRTLDINLTGVFLCLKHEVRAMRDRGGAIVNNVSMAGLRGNPGLPAYHASKHGVVGLTKAAALEFVEHGVRVNAVCPGVIVTPKAMEFFGGDEARLRQAQAAMHPMNRVGEPDEVAALVLFLCSEAAGFITGVAIPIDGGAGAALGQGRPAEFPGSRGDNGSN